MLEENLFLLQTVGNCRKLSKNVENLSKTVNHCLKMSEKVERSGIQKTPYKNAQLSSTCPRAGSSSPRTIFGRRHADTEPPSPHTSFIIFSRFFTPFSAVSTPYRCHIDANRSDQRFVRKRLSLSFNCRNSRSSQFGTQFVEKSSSVKSSFSLVPT